MPKLNIIFNLDDTLIHGNKYFMQVINQFTDQMIRWFPSVSREDIKKKQLHIDIEKVDKYGLTLDHFPQSFVDTYAFYCEETGRQQKEEDILLLRELGYSVFDMPVEPLPDMYETLERLKGQGHELYLHTGGEEENQRRKITQLELATYFENRIFISKRKDTTALSDIMKTTKFDPAITWMVGNSLRTDILPALELGVHAIYIPPEKEWEYNMVEIHIEPKAAFLQLGSLKEVPDAIVGRNFR